MNLKSIPDTIPIFGDVNWRGECSLETPAMVGGMQLIKKEFPQFDGIMIHVRNEDKRSKRHGKKMKDEGMVTGFVDVVITCCPPIVMEVKRQDHTLSKIDTAQIKCLVLSQRQGAFSCVALGAMGMLEAVRAWHSINAKK